MPDYEPIVHINGLGRRRYQPAIDGKGITRLSLPAADIDPSRAFFPVLCRTRKQAIRHARKVHRRDRKITWTKETE